MPRRSNKNVKEDEIMIMHELEKNANESIDKIAKTCKFSRQKVWRIIKRLEHEKSIWGYTIAPEDKKIGMNTYFALTKSNGPFTNADEPIKAIKDNLQEKLGVTILDIHYLNGIYDWIIMFSATNISEAKKICNFLQKKFENIDRVDLLESVFPLVKARMVNPDLDKLKEYAVK